MRGPHLTGHDDGVHHLSAGPQLALPVRDRPTDDHLVRGAEALLRLVERLRMGRQNNPPDDQTTDRMLAGYPRQTGVMRQRHYQPLR